MHTLWKDDSGQDIAEYAVMLAVILVIVVGTVRLIGTNANNVPSNDASDIQSTSRSGEHCISSGIVLYGACWRLHLLSIYPCLHTTLPAKVEPNRFESAGNCGETLALRFCPLPRLVAHLT